VRPLPQPAHNLCLAIREQQNKGYLPDGTTRLSRGGEEIRHFMGTSTFAEYTVMPEIALAKISPEAPLDRACLFACGLSTGLRVAGSSFGGVKGREQVPLLVQRYLDGDIDVDPFLSHRLTLDEVNRGFELMHAQDGIRSVIEF
jgi:Zn-dependent alcohol dehydrogenase